MQFKKVVAAGAVGLLMAGSSIAFAASLGDYPVPFVTADGMQSLVVVGSGGTDPAGLASDVAGAIDIATRLAGAVTKDVTVGGTIAGVSVSGEGKAVSTTNTKIFLDDTLGKSGLRSTMTKDDMPTLLANGILQDADASTTHNYQQFVYITPGNTSDSNYAIQYEKPSSDSTKDPTYSIGDWPQSPTPLTLTGGNGYLYRTAVVFDKEVNGTTAVGEKLKIFGKEYTILSDTTFINGDGSSSNKLVISGGAETKVLKAGESVQVTLGTTTYDVTLVGTSSATAIVLKVGSDQKTVNKAATTSVGGLDIFVDDVFQLSTTDQTVNSAKLLLGAQKLILQHGSKVKTGTNEDVVQGTYVNLTVSSGKLASFNVYVGGTSSDNDFLGLGGTYKDPVWKTFKLAFPSISPATDSATGRNTLSVDPSGDNDLKTTIIDDKGQTATINWAHKATSSGTALSLQDASANNIIVQEGATISQNQYFVVDAGDFSHMFQATSISLDGTTSSYIDLRDVFSGATIRVSPSTDNIDSKVIDGQTYYFRNRSSSTFSVTWGAGASDGNAGTFTTLYPVLKGKAGEKYALVKPLTDLAVNTTYQLPTGATTTTTGVTDGMVNLTVAATTIEDGTASALTATTTLNLSSAGLSKTFTLGRTTTGGTVYNITANGQTFNLTVAGSGAAGATQPSILLVEEKDDSSNVYSVHIAAATETSSSNNIASLATPDFTATEDTSALASDTNQNRYVDLYGVYVEEKTSNANSMKVKYPDEQVVANVFVLAEGASTSESGGASATTVKQAVAVKTAVGRIDSEVGDTEKSTKNLILVGGPCVNSLVSDLATASKFDYSCGSWPNQNIGVIKLVEDAFTTGKSALVIAGTTKTETRNAAKILMQYDDYATSLAAKKTVKVVDTTVSDLS